MQRAGENKDAPDYQESLARVYRNLGDVERGRGVVDKAAAAYETGRKILDNLLSKQPDIQRFRSESARNHNSVGLLLEKQKKNDGAAAEFGKAQKLWNRLFRDHPANQEYASELAIVYRNLAESPLSPRSRKIRSPGAPVGSTNLMRRAKVRSGREPRGRLHNFTRLGPTCLGIATV